MLQNFEVEWSWKANEQESRREFMHAGLFHKLRRTQ